MNYPQLDCKRCKGKKTRFCIGYTYENCNMSDSTIHKVIEQIYYYNCDSCGDSTSVKFDSNGNPIAEWNDV